MSATPAPWPPPPAMRARGLGGYVVNTASIGGLQVNPGKLKMGPYAMTKYAVVAISESLRQDLEPDGITVSVFCPGAVNTGIWQSGRNRHEKYGGPTRRHEDHPFRRHLKDEGMHPDQAGDILLRAMGEGPGFIFTDPENRAWIEARHAKLMAGFDLAEKIRQDLGL